MAPVTTDQAVLQRLFATKSTRDCRQSIIVQSLIIVPISLMLYLAGVALYVFYQSHPARLAGLNSVDAVMPFFAIRELPVGMSGMIIAAIFAASMAVMSAGINSLTTATVVDFYKRIFRPNESEQRYAFVGRLGTLGWGLAMTLVALFADHLGELAIAYSRVSSFISGPLLGIFLLAVLTKRTTPAGALIGSGAGAAAVVVCSFLTRWSFLYLGPIGVAATFIVGYFVSLPMTPPAPEKIRGYVYRQGEIVDWGKAASPES
jgi:sodium-coupled monocarboxylate transporter 8/12